MILFMETLALFKTIFVIYGSQLATNRLLFVLLNTDIAFYSIGVVDLNAEELS